LDRHSDPEQKRPWRTGPLYNTAAKYKKEPREALAPEHNYQYLNHNRGAAFTKAR
jgi:hypothetical protein